MKICKRCGDKFEDGKWCKACAIRRAAAYRQKYPDKTKAAVKRWIQNNAAKFAATKKIWRANNLEKHNSYSAKHKKNHPEQISAQHRAYRERNSDKIKLSSKIYKQEHRVEVLIATRKRQAAQLRAIPAWASDEWDAFVVSEMYHLSALRTEFTGIKWHVDHTIPLQNKLVCGLHCAANLAVIPAKLNYQKNNKYWPDMP